MQSNLGVKQAEQVGVLIGFFPYMRTSRQTALELMPCRHCHRG